MKIDHKFMKTIPDDIETGTLYISIDYMTAIHKCCCGCENKVVTPFSPNDWKLTLDGKTVSLYPSIGNFNDPCQSHYWIKNSLVLFIPNKQIKILNKFKMVESNEILKKIRAGLKIAKLLIYLFVLALMIPFLAYAFDLIEGHPKDYDIFHFYVSMIVLMVITIEFIPRTWKSIKEAFN